MGANHDRAALRRGPPVAVGLARAVAAAPWRARVVLAMLALSAMLALVGRVALADATVAPVTVLEVQGPIGPATADYVERGIRHAHAAGAPLVVIRLDTPGGLDTSMRQIVQAILGAPLPVAVYVAPSGARAASAGTYILYAAHVAAMAPATTLGAATPVNIGLPGPRAPGPGASDAPPPATPADPSAAKAVHDAAAYIRALAQQRGRNAEWAERAVREAATLTSDEAVRDQVADLVARDVGDLLAQLHGRSLRVGDRDLTLDLKGRAVEPLPPDARQKLLSALANPSIALVLLMIGIYGLIFEFSSPGFGVAGIAGAICLLLAMFALQMLPFSYAGLGLLLLGTALMVAEVVTPSFGVFGVGGFVAFVAGGLLLFDRDIPGMGVPLALLLTLGLATAGVVLLGGSLLLRARRRAVVSGREQLVGADGRVLGPAADGAVWALVHGERWRAVPPAGEPLPQAGEAVRVVAVDGLTLRVHRTPPDPSRPQEDTR